MVEVGERVEAGAVIAMVGRSGRASGPHVHFEVRRDGMAYNPLHLLDPPDQSPVCDDDMAASSRSTNLTSEGVDGSEPETDELEDDDEPSRPSSTRTPPSSARSPRRPRPATAAAS